MYEVGQLVVYGTHGVCQIVDLEEKQVDKRLIPYFVLEPVEHPGTKYFMPSQNETALSKIRPLMDDAQIRQVLSECVAAEWIPVDNRRRNRYRELLSGVQVTEVLSMLRAVYAHRRGQMETGKKLHQCDDQFMTDAHKIFIGEIMQVMQISRPEALELLHSYLDT